MVNTGGWVLSFPQPQPQPLPLPSGWFPISRGSPKPSHFFGITLSLRLSRFLNTRLFSSGLQDVWSRRPFQFQEFNLMKWSPHALSTTASLLFFFDEGHGGNERRAETSRSSSGTSNGTPSERQWTNVLLAMNVLLYIAQVATQGKMMLWGAKINSLISRGELWRLITSSFLHANVGHLLINCYSLNAVGLAVEAISGPRRFFTIYLTSAVASAATSYWMCKAPAVGASGAIFGLVGSFAVFVMRHRGLVGRGTEDLQHIARVIFLNMVIGVLSKGIDNWGHLGGLLGGVAMSWLIGPAWEFESITKDGRRVFCDRAPISRLLNKTMTPPLTR